MIRDLLLTVVFVIVLGTVTWLCEKYRPLIVLGGILLAITLMTWGNV